MSGSFTSPQPTGGSGGSLTAPAAKKVKRLAREARGLPEQDEEEEAPARAEGKRKGDVPKAIRDAVVAEARAYRGPDPTKRMPKGTWPLVPCLATSFSYVACNP